MPEPRPPSTLSPAELATLLSVTRRLAAPFELHAMLEAVADAARQVLHAERASVWLHDPARDDLFIEVASDLPPIRVPVGTGLVGAAARSRVSVNVPDCYADPRFNREVDRRSGFRTRCCLALPLIDHEGTLVGVMQLLNREGGVFDDGDLALAEALAAQCAVALARARMADAVLAARLLQQELELASRVQRSTQPQAMPRLPGYAMHAVFRPASQAGGDTFDLALLDPGLLVMLADASGHGLGPALSVTQMHAMLRMALRLGAPLETAFTQVNDQLSTTLHDGHFVNTFVGLLDPATHRLRFLSGGQGPILHLHADHGRCTVHRATSFPLGAMPITRLRPAIELALAPGDWLVLLSDGLYEYDDAQGEPFGRARVEALLQAHRGLAPAAMAERLLDALAAHAGAVPQADDITLVLLRRDDPA